MKQTRPSKAKVLTSVRPAKAVHMGYVGYTTPCKLIWCRVTEDRCMFIALDVVDDWEFVTCSNCKRARGRNG